MARRAARTGGTLLVVAGGLLTATVVKQIVFPGFAEFVLITLAHLGLAAGVAVVAVLGIRWRLLGIAVAAVWSAGWLGMFASEALMLAFILPPAWLSPAVPTVILVGSAMAAVTAVAAHRSSILERLGVARACVPVLAFGSALGLGAQLVVGALPGMTSGSYLAIVVSAESLSALVVLAVGIVVLRSARRARGSAPTPGGTV